MTMLPGPSVEVSQPALDVPAVGTLLNTFEPVATDDGHWELGYHFLTWGACLAAFSWGTNCQDPENLVFKTPGTGSTTVETVPMQVYAPFRCSTFGFDEDEYKEAARDALRLMGGQQLEAELWGGALALAGTWPNRYLADISAASPADGVNAGAYGWPAALAVLQDGLRRCSGEVAGVIHASPKLVGMWTGTEAVFERDGKLRDHFGNFIVAGGGYTGQLPDVAATWGVEYAFATDMIDVRVGDVQILGEDVLAEATRRDINEVDLIAEATMSAAWARCCHLYVQASIADPCLYPAAP